MIWRTTNILTEALGSPIYSKVRRYNLGLERLETQDAGDEKQPRLLWQLIERYASSECERPCDHVYALYNLVGEHRKQLDIDYPASPVQRLISVLRFVTTHESPTPRWKLIELAQLLVRLFEIKPRELSCQRQLLEAFAITVPFMQNGTVELQPETKVSIALRTKVMSLHPMPKMHIQISDGTRHLLADKSLDSSYDVWCHPTAERYNHQSHVGRQDMSYFTIAQPKLHGLALCKLKADDVIWHVPSANLACVVRAAGDRRERVVERAYLFSAVDSTRASEDHGFQTRTTTFEFWPRTPSVLNDFGRSERLMNMDLATLLALLRLLIATEGGDMESRLEAVRKERATEVRAAEKRTAAEEQADWQNKLIERYNLPKRELNKREELLKSGKIRLSGRQLSKND